MQTCSCGASFSGYGYKCQSCLTRETIKEENEKNRRQTESLANQNAALAQRQAYEQREQMDRLSRQQQAIAAQQQEMAEQQMFIENQKLNELQKQTRLIEEQATSVDDAFEEGYSLADFESKLFENDTNFYHLNPYLTPKLNKSFAEGVGKKVADIFAADPTWVDLLKLNIKEIAIQKRELFLNYECDINNVDGGTFYVPVQLYFKGVTVSFGYLLIDLRLNVEESTGEASFINKNHEKITSNNEINDVFNDAFKFDQALELVNERNKKLRRLENILNGKITEWNTLLEQAKSSNDKVTLHNIRAFSAYGAVAFGFYLIANGNILYAFAVWILSAFVVGVDWSIKSGISMTKGLSALASLKSALSNTRGELYGESQGVVSSSEVEPTSVPISKNSPLKITLIVLVIVWVLFSLIFYYKPSLLPQKISSIFALNLPADVAAFATKKESCDHFLGEPAYDNLRKKFLKDNIRKFCPNTDIELDLLKIKYKDDKVVLGKLANYSSVGIIETGSPFGEWYLGFRKKILSSNWKPWKFIPIDGYISPFPEVLACDEGFCDVYFINKSGSLVLKVTYKICGSEYVGNCAGYESGFLMIEDYETISLEEAKRLNKVAKDHFE